MRYKDKTEDDTKNRERIFVLNGINRFGERLKVAMNGMSNNELARKSGMSETTIRKYLKGDIYPGIDSAALVAEACGVPLIWLISGLEQKDEAESREEVTDPILEAILQRLPTEQGQQLANAILIHGVSGIIAALNGMAAIDEFMLIPENDRERVLRLYKQIKEGDSGGDIGSAQGHPIKEQRAG